MLIASALHWITSYRTNCIRNGGSTERRGKFSRTIEFLSIAFLKRRTKIIRKNSWNHQEKYIQIAIGSDAKCPRTAFIRNNHHSKVEWLVVVVYMIFSFLKATVRETETVSYRVIDFIWIGHRDDLWSKFYCRILVSFARSRQKSFDWERLRASD